MCEKLGPLPHLLHPKTHSAKLSLGPAAAAGKPLAVLTSELVQAAAAVHAAAVAAVAVVPAVPARPERLLALASCGIVRFLDLSIYLIRTTSWQLVDDDNFEAHANCKRNTLVVTSRAAVLARPRSCSSLSPDHDHVCARVARRRGRESADGESYHDM